MPAWDSNSCTWGTNTAFLSGDPSSKQKKGPGLGHRLQYKRGVQAVHGCAGSAWDRVYCMCGPQKHPYQADHSWRIFR